MRRDLGDDPSMSCTSMVDLRIRGCAHLGGADLVDPVDRLFGQLAVVM